MALQFPDALEAWEMHDLPRADLEKHLLHYQSIAADIQEQEYRRGYDNGYQEGSESRDCDDCGDKDRRIRALERENEALKQSVSPAPHPAPGA